MDCYTKIGMEIENSTMVFEDGGRNQVVSSIETPNTRP
jgi:hypothetical protein